MRIGMLSRKMNMMNYLLAPESVAERQTVFRELKEAIGPDSRLEMFPDVAGFSARLRRFNNPEIIVILAVGKENMPNLLSLFDLGYYCPLADVHLQSVHSRPG